MTTLSSIKRLYAVIDNSLFMTTGKLDYERITEATIKLADAVHNFPMPDDGYEIWDIGEFGTCTLSDYIVGAYWHFAEWHQGQNSPGYAALSSLGQVFSPGMTSIESEKADDSSAVEAYDALQRSVKETLMPLPNRAWLQRTRRSMCGNYQALCQISMVNRDRLRDNKKNVYTDEQVEKLDHAIGRISESINALNVILELPEGS